MRVIAGRFRGARLAAPSDDAIRPTSDRVREAVFNILAHGIAWRGFEGAVVLDLFAGTGALGIEALSRGAASCLFVEEAAEARALIRENVEALGLIGVTRIFRRDATALGDAGKLGPFDIVFLDPPYDQGLGERALAAATAGGWVADQALAVIEERAGVGLAPPLGWREFDRRSWGETQVLFLERTGGTS